MKKSISKNYIYNVVYQVLILIIPLVTTPYIARVLSVDGVGTYSFTYSIASFFAIFAELGTIAYARREVAYCQDDKNKRSILFWEIFLFRLISSLICQLVYFIYILNSDFFLIGLIQIMYIVSVVFDITWFFQGMEDFKTVVIRNTAVKVLGLIFIFAFVKNESDLILYIAGLAAMQLLGNLVAWVPLPKYIKKVKIKELKPFKHFKGTMALFIPNIASQVYLLLDKTMLGMMTADNIENGYYEQAQKIIKMSWTFLTTFSAVMAPRIAFLYKKNEKEEMKGHIRKSFSFIWLLATALCFGIVAIAGNIVPWFLGTAYDKVVVLLTIFAFILYPIGITCVTGTIYLVTIRKQTVYTISIISGAVLNFVLNFILIPKFYSVGAAISSVAAECIIAIVQIIYVCYFLEDIKIKDVFYKVWQYLLAGVVMLGALKYLCIYISATAIHSVILIGCGAMIYFTVLLLLRNELMFDGIKLIKKFLKKKTSKAN